MVTSPFAVFIAPVLQTPQLPLDMPRKVIPVPAVKAPTETPAPVVAKLEAFVRLINPEVGVPPGPAVPPKVLSRTIAPDTSTIGSIDAPAACMV